MRLPTIKDVASRSGVGIGTVSRVLNNSEQVSPETRMRVLAAIQELGFQPNRAARQLSSGTRIQTMGVMLPFLSYYPFVERLRGIQSVLHENERDFELILYDVSFPEYLDRQLQTITQQRSVTALLLVTLELTEAQRSTLAKAGITYLGISDRCSGEYPCVGIDNVSAARMAVRHLIELGHQRIAYVGDIFDDPFHFPTSQDRYEGYRQELEQHGIPVNPDYVRLGVHGRDIARQLTAELLQLDTLPTAIFAMSDAQALGCITAITEAGLRVPEDISVMGFDNIEISYYTGLTTINQHLEASGRIGATAIINLLNQNFNTMMLQMPEPELVIRKSTSVPKI
ncbi:MAG: LacI family DNA-binding transcriptional regulator [Anaerolineae bacterium]